MFNPLHGSMNWELFEMHLHNQSSHYKNTNGATYPCASLINYCLKDEVFIMLCRQLGLTPQQNKSRTPQKAPLLSKHSLCKKYGRLDYVMQRKLSYAITKLTLFVIIANTLYAYCSMPKGTSRAEATLNSVIIKSIPLAIVELLWSGSINQSGSQPVENPTK